MGVKVPEGQETEMNMTPMIDIVFQLIVFFLLSLKFKTVDMRIQSELPKDRGIQSTNTFVDDLPLITVKLFRKNPEDPKTMFTRIRVGQDRTIDLPEGEWPTKGQAEKERQDEYEEKFAQVVRAIVDIWNAQERNPEIKGEIKTPGGYDETQQRITGSSVPHGDVVKVLDSFLQAGIVDVKFEGAPPPMPTTGGVIGAGR